MVACGGFGGVYCCDFVFGGWDCAFFWGVEGRGEEDEEDEEDEEAVREYGVWVDLLLGEVGGLMWDRRDRQGGKDGRFQLLD